MLRHNTKGHSFIQHFPLFLLPQVLDRTYVALAKELIGFLAAELKVAFDSGITVRGVTYRLVLIGSKGDLKWISKIPSLTRGYETATFAYLGLLGYHQRILLLHRAGWEACFLRGLIQSDNQLIMFFVLSFVPNKAIG